MPGTLLGVQLGARCSLPHFTVTAEHSCLQRLCPWCLLKPETKSVGCRIWKWAQLAPGTLLRAQMRARCTLHAWRDWAQSGVMLLMRPQLLEPWHLDRMRCLHFPALPSPVMQANCMHVACSATPPAAAPQSLLKACSTCPKHVRT